MLSAVLCVLLSCLWGFARGKLWLSVDLRTVLAGDDRAVAVPKARGGEWYPPRQSQYYAS